MIRRYGLFLTLTGMLLGLNAIMFSQLTRPGKPRMVNHGDPVVISLDAVAKASEKAVSQNEDSLRLKPALSGALIPVDYNPANSGSWHLTDDGTKLWQLAFSIENASLMNIIFSPFRLNQGVRVYLYDMNGRHIIGAFSDLNNKDINILATSNIPGNNIVIEVQVPSYAKGPGEIGIKGVGCDFADNLKKDEWFGVSGECNLDISCLQDPLIQQLKNSVVRIVFNGHHRCTGTLLNHTSNKGAYYVLTAGHCIESEEEANSAVIYFNYESPYCEGPDGNNSRSLSGATLRSRSDKIDFALLELLEPVPYNFNPYYAGWDYRKAPPESGFVIHHPLGDVKKISVEQHPLSIADFGSFYNENNHYLVSHWETGTTEAGSSGAPLFDPEGRLRATLTGGLASCKNPVKDYFQMFSHSWKDLASPESQLAIWLDPSGKTDGFLDGTDPFAEFKATGDTLSNIGLNENLTRDADGLAWGSWSGHNNLGTIQFAEKFETTAKRLNGINLYVENNYISRPDRYLDIVIWNGNSVPLDVIYSQRIPLENLLPQTLNFIEFDSSFSPGSSFFAGYQLYYPSPQDTFSLFMAENRSPDGLSTAFVSDGSGWQNLSEYSIGLIHSSFAIFPVVYGNLPPQKDTLTEDEVQLYPNPASSYFQVRFKEMSAEAVVVSVINTSGQILMQREYDSYQHIIPIELKRFSNGIYMVNVRRGALIYTMKLAVFK